MLFALFDVVAGELTVDDDVTVTVIVDVVGGGLTARGGVFVGVVCGDRSLSSAGGGLFALKSETSSSSMSNGLFSCPITV